MNSVADDLREDLRERNRTLPFQDRVDRVLLVVRQVDGERAAPGRGGDPEVVHQVAAERLADLPRGLADRDHRDRDGRITIHQDISGDGAQDSANDCGNNDESHSSAPGNADLSIS